MKAVILAAGKGTRMRDLTDEVPKPMLKVQGKPILKRILEGLKDAGIHEACIITGFRAETIESYFGNGAAFGMKLSYTRQATQDGTGKAPELAKSFVGDSPFLLTYGDILVAPQTYQRMLDRFHQGDFSGVITVTRGEEVAKGGLMLFDSAFCLESLVEKPTDQELQQLRSEGKIGPGLPLWYNAGIYIFRPSLFDYTQNLEKSARGEYELTDAIASMLKSGHVIAGREIEGRWVDVRDPEVLAALEREEI